MGEQLDPNRDDVDDPEEEESTEESTEEGTNTEEGTEETDAERVTRLEEENERMRRALKKANREAAKRRIAAKEGKDPATDDKKDSPELTAALEELKALREEKQRRASDDVVKKQKDAVTKLAAKYKFLHPEDVVALAGIEFDPEDADFNPADFEPSIKLLAKKRPELLNLGTPRDIDAKRQGSRGDELSIDEDTIAVQYGIRTGSKNSKEK